jgi:DNA repair exonuclease SbcCD ATPase subunit
MSTPQNLPDLKELMYEKRILITIIGIMMLSLLYMSFSARLIKDENQRFQAEIHEINTSLVLLEELLPAKDSIIESQQKGIEEQAKELLELMESNNTTRQQRDELQQKLQQLKVQLKDLKQQLREAAIAQAEAPQPEVFDAVAYAQYIEKAKDEILQTKEEEIARLKSVVTQLRLRTPSTITQGKPFVSYFEAIASDKKSRASKTDYLALSLQLKGELADLNGGILGVQIIDPENRLISRKEEKLKASTDGVTLYRFVPENYKFVKGRYRIRVFYDEAELESRTSLVLY